MSKHKKHMFEILCIVLYILSFNESDSTLTFRVCIRCRAFVAGFKLDLFRYTSLIEGSKAKKQRKDFNM